MPQLAASQPGCGALAEELTDRKLSILRALPGLATQREIGAALFLSINTVNAYDKDLYRKLGVASRHDAIADARVLLPDLRPPRVLSLLGGCADTRTTDCVQTWPIPATS